MEARNLFSSKEVEEEAKKESVKTFVPGEVENASKPVEEKQTSTMSAPTPEQIIAIKVCTFYTI